MNKKQARIAWIMVILVSLTSAIGGLAFFTNSSGEVGSILAGLFLLPLLPIILIGGLSFFRAKGSKENKVKGQADQPSPIKGSALISASSGQGSNSEELIEVSRSLDAETEFPIIQQDENKPDSAGQEGILAAPAVSKEIAIGSTLQTADKTSSDLKYSKPGGWLVLICIGLFLAPVRIIIFLVQNASSYSPRLILLLLDPETQYYNPLLAFLLIFELFVNVLFIAWAIVLLILLFRTKRSFKWVMITYLALNVIIVSADLLIANSIPLLQSQISSNDSVEVIRSFVGAAIWIPYLFISKRVKGTFTN